MRRTRLSSYCCHFYEGVREIVLSVVIKTVFTKDLENFQENFQQKSPLAPLSLRM